jgi:hypothetical protein
MNTQQPPSSGSLHPLVRIPSVQFTRENSADNNRVFLWENCDDPPFVRAVHGWKIIGYGEAPWAKGDNHFAVMFEKQIPKGGYPTIKGEEMDEGDRIWQHFDERWLREMGNANDQAHSQKGRERGPDNTQD